jgi:hypothetical protein
MTYYEIKIKSTIAKELYDYAFNSQPWFPHYNFNVKPIPTELIAQDNFFKWLHARYGFVAGVLKLDPYTCYDWHTDTRRGVGINMLLTPFNRSVCAFAPNKEGAVFEIEELKYKPATYYIFNTQVPHTVYNFETTRYLMSVEFAKDKDALTFDTLMHDIKDNYEKDRT